MRRCGIRALPCVSHVGDVLLGTDEGLAGDDDDAFVVGAGGVRGEMGVEGGGGFGADDRETSVSQLKDVGTGFLSHAPSLPRGVAETAGYLYGRERVVH